MDFFAADSLGHDLYDRPGPTQAERQIGYRALFRDALDAGLIDALRAATNGGWALARDRQCAGPTGRTTAERTTAQAKDAGSPAKLL